MNSLRTFAFWRTRSHPHWQPAWHAVLRVVGAAVLVVYCGWQAFWLCQGRIPPALFLALTGLPAPTTGGTRAMMQLLRGDWQVSVYHNAMAVPLTLLFLLSGGWLLVQGLRRRRWRLPQGFFVAWLVVLAVAWITKLAQAALVSADFAS